jgi:hypothetical protein
MAIQEYAGAIVLELNGQEFECTQATFTNNTGRKLVKTMNSTGRAKGFMQGIRTYDISGTVVIPVGSTDIDWDNLTDAKLTYYPIDDTGNRITYQDCFSMEYGDKYSVDNEAVRDFKMAALNRVIE